MKDNKETSNIYKSKSISIWLHSYFSIFGNMTAATQLYLELFQFF